MDLFHWRQNGIQKQKDCFGRCSSTSCQCRTGGFGPGEGGEGRMPKPSAELQQPEQLRQPIWRLQYLLPESIWTGLHNQRLK
jgi:hypothetical protein